MGAGAGPVYDIFSSEGSLDGSIELAVERRVIGFGADAVYVVAYDELDLNYLERYAMPSK